MRALTLSLASMCVMVPMMFVPAVRSFAQAPAAEFHSTTVNPDRTVTFRYRDPSATKVELSLEGEATNEPMAKGEGGVWSVTTKPLAPEIYGYSFEVDGRRELDPHHPLMTRNLLSVRNMVEVHGEGAEPWDPQNVPHGEVQLHLYTSEVVQGLPDHQSEYYVYTPPGYDARDKREYPVLYLLHGFSDDASGWTAVGRANLILDSLLAEGKIKPMVVVMPLGYGDISFVRSGFNGWRTPAVVANNTDLFTKALLTEVLPRVEAEYRVSKKRDDRAIAGLSMGGLESLSTGLNNTDKFAYVVGMSSAAASVDRERLANLTPKSANLKLLWVACGTEDGLLQANRDFITFLKSKNMPVTAVETPGMHTWMVWRDNLVHFAPLLFQGR